MYFDSIPQTPGKKFKNHKAVEWKCGENSRKPRENAEKLAQQFSCSLLLAIRFYCFTSMLLMTRRQFLCIIVSDMNNSVEHVEITCCWNHWMNAESFYLSHSI